MTEVPVLGKLPERLRCKLWSERTISGTPCRAKIDLKCVITAADVVEVNFATSKNLEK